MYLSHYNLIEKPFEITPDPSFLWLSEKHKEGWAALEYGICENKGFLLLTGDIGTGKTVLINYLIKSTEVRSVIATIPDPDLESLDFFNILSAEFQMNRQFDSKGKFLVEFKDFLHQNYGSDRKVLLIIDEAQRLNSELLGQIRALSNIEMANRKLINIFFVGQSEFVNMLREERNEAVRKRITVSYHLDPFSESETEQYILHRLNVAGADGMIFTHEAICEIYSFTCGYPRLINIICDNALLAGYSKELSMIDVGIIIECEKDLHILSDKHQTAAEETEPEGVQETYEYIETPKKKRHTKRIGIFVSLIMLTVLSVYLLYNFQTVNTLLSTIKEIVQPKNVEISEKQALNNEIAQKRPSKETQSNRIVPAKKSVSPQEISELPPKQDDHHRNDLIPIKNLTAFQDKLFTIHFKHKSNKIPDNSIQILDQIIRISSKYPELGIVVEGHTDSHGNYFYNKKLSQIRADAVKNYFVSKGIPAKKISTFGMGSENPIEGNETFAGRKINRRVEIKLKIELAQ